MHDIANIGIDAAGNSESGLAGAYDYARNGLIHNNEVYRCMSSLAPAAGIYLDGSYGIAVYDNYTHHNAV